MCRLKGGVPWKRRCNKGESSLYVYRKNWLSPQKTKIQFDFKDIKSNPVSVTRCCQILQTFVRLLNFWFSIGHFTVMDGSEAEGDLVLIQTLSALLWKLFSKNTSLHKNNLIDIIKQEGLYQNKVTLSLVSIHNCKMAYLLKRKFWENCT